MSILTNETDYYIAYCNLKHDIGLDKHCQNFVQVYEYLLEHYHNWIVMKIGDRIYLRKGHNEPNVLEVRKRQTIFIR